MIDRTHISRSAGSADAQRRRRPSAACQIAPLFAALAVLLLSVARLASAQGIQVTNTNFPTTYASQSVQQTVTMTVGADAVVIDNIQVALGNPDYFIYGSPTCAMGIVLAPGTVCTALVQFQPQHPGYALSPAPIGRSAPFQIMYVDQVTLQSVTQSVLLTGSGSNPQGVIVPGVISDLVGNDVTPHSGFAGDGGLAAGALFAIPAAIAMDVLGNIYIADSGNNAVRVVYAGGIIPNVVNPLQGHIYTIAGVPTAAGAGVDGLPATASPLSNPIGVAVDALGNVYISDSNNGAVRMVNAATGIITTVAGTLNSTTLGFSGDGGPATAALLSVPSGIAVDGNGNLFIADSNNNAVRVVYAGGTQLAALIALEIPGTTAVPGNIYTIAGGPANAGLPRNGDGGLASLGNLNSPAAVVTDSNGNVYIADFGNVAVRRVDAMSGDFSTVYQGVDGPTNLSVDASDDIYFTGHTYCTISQYNPTVQASLTALSTTTVVGNGICTASGDGYGATSAGLSGAESVVVDGLGNLYVLESDGVRTVNGHQAAFNFGTVNLGTADTLSGVVTDEDILPVQGQSPNVLQNPAFQVGYSNPQLFSIVPYTSTNPNIFDCDGVLTSNYLRPGQSCGMAVEFSPTQDGGPFLGYAESPGMGDLTSLSGSGTGSAPTAALTGTPMNFVAIANEGYSTPQNFLLTNTSSAALTISSIGFTSTGVIGFYETDTCGFFNGTTYGPLPPLAPGASCQIKVKSSASAIGSGSGSLVVVDNASSGGGTQTLPLTGTSIAPGGSFTPFPSLGLVASPGSVSGAQTVTLSNNGMATLHINPTSWAFTGNEPGRFSISRNNCGSTLAVGANCQIGVTFSPLSYGYYAAYLTVQDDSGGVRIVNGNYQWVTQYEPLSGGTGNPPAQLTSFTLGNAVFPPTAVGQSTTQTVTLTLNNAVALNSFAIASGFSEYSIGTVAGCAIGGAVNAAGTVCSLPVTFTPVAVGIRNAPLQVVDVETHGPVPYAFGLSGTGTGPLASLTPGVITTLVGSSTGLADGIVGTDGPGPKALVGFQSGMAIDPLGQVFVADTLNDVIWKTDTSGNIHLYAGTPFVRGSLIEPIAGEGGTALGSELGLNFGGLELDSKDGLYFVDLADNYGNPTRIRYIDPATSMISTAVGFVPPGTWAPTTSFATTTQIVVTVAAVKYLFTALQGGSSGSVEPLMWPTVTGQTVTDGSVIWDNEGSYYGSFGCGAETDDLGDGCKALQVALGTPGFIALDQAGNLYFTDSARVRRVDAVTKIVSVVAGNGVSGNSGDNGPATSANINPGDLAFDGNGNLYFIDSLRYVRMVNMSTGIITTVSGGTIVSSQQQGYCAGQSGDAGPEGNAGYAGWSSMAIDPANNIYLADQAACVVRRIDMGTQIIQTVAGSPNAQYPTNSAGYGDLGQANSDGSALEASLNHPAQVRLDGLGNLYIGSAWGGVREVNVSQSILPFAGPYGQHDNSQQVDTVSAPLSATVLNAGNASLLHFNSPFISPSWGISNNNFTRDVTDPTGSADCYDLELLSAGFECPINVDFTPQAISTLPLTAQDTVTNDAANTPQTIQLSGFGIGPTPLVTLLPSLLTFFTPQGGSSSQNLVLTNNDTNPLPISSITIIGGGASAFTQTTCGTFVAAQSSCTIAVTFSPGIVSTHGISAPPPDIFKATVVVTDTAGSQTAQLVGTGTLPAVSTTPLIIQETITFSDNVPAPAPVTPLNISETITFTDYVPPLVPPTTLNIHETISASDSLPAVVPATLLNIHEAIVTSDKLPTVVPSTLLNIVESLHVTDRGLPMLPPIVIPIIESISVTDADSSLPSIAISVVESVHVTDNIIVTMNKVTPTIAMFPTASSITYGQTLASSTLTGGIASTAGTFTWTASTTAASVGTASYSVTFAPTDAAGYNTATGNVSVTTNKATPTITNLPVASSITYGQTLASSTLTGGVASVPGAFTWTTNTTVPNAGTASYSVTFAPDDNTDYKTETATVPLTVNQAAQTINFIAPTSPVTYAVGSLTLSATGGASGNPVTFSVLSGPATTSGSTLSITGVGTIVVAANQAGNANYFAATQVTQSVVVNPIGVAAAPTFSPVAGAYTTVQTVTIGDATSGTIIYYTTNGTIPTGNSSVYVAAISVSSTETLQAIAMATGYTTSAVATAVYAINNSVPVISSLSPAANSAGGTAFTLTVNGSGFSLSSTVYWGTSALATQYGSSSQLTAQVTAADIATAGITGITVQTPAPGGGTSSAFQFEVDSAGSGSILFTTVTATVIPGSTATYQVTLPNATNVTVTCLNLPAGATCSYSSATKSVMITTSPTTPAGTYQITVVFTLTEAGSATGVILLPFLGLPIVLLRRRMAARGAWVAACLGLILLAGTAVGCVGGSAATHKVTSSSIITLTVQ